MYLTYENKLHDGTFDENKLHDDTFDENKLHDDTFDENKLHDDTFVINKVYYCYSFDVVLSYLLVQFIKWNICFRISGSFLIKTINVHVSMFNVCIHYLSLVQNTIYLV